MIRRNNFSQYLSLRKDFPRFIYDSYRYYLEGNHLVIRFKFIIPPGFEFHPEARIEWKASLFRDPDSLSAGIMDNLVFHIGMAELVSYWKAVCPPTIVIPAGRLGREQGAFWNKLYFHGLGEFFYANTIAADPASFAVLEGDDHRGLHAAPLSQEGPPLVPIGGGKDSAVTAALLSRHGTGWIPFAINPTKATLEVIRAAGKTPASSVLVRRRLDPLLLDLNARGYLNGHTPFSSVVAFYSLLAAYLSGSRDIILSNESSANEATIPGTGINHQYSKTLEFENDFRKYVREMISPDLDYFSLLRPLTELQIGNLFRRFPSFFKVFRSCNVGSKTGSWCGRCPKCLFTWIILSPFLDQQQLREIFGRDLTEDPGLAGTLDELTGIAETKPFECIGTVEEVNAALDHLIRQYHEKDLPVLLQHYRQQKKAPEITEDMFHQLLSARDPHHFVPRYYQPLLKDEPTD